jgi:glycosyltransferase involved in cell wall biosynthesis
MKRQLRVLVIAEAANPEWVSVPLVGWSMATALRRVADVHIVTQVRNRDAFVRAGLVEGIDFSAIDTENVAAPAHKLASLLRGGKGKGWTLVTAVSTLIYPFFERQVWKRFGVAIRRGEYDIVHRITPLSPTTPSSIARKCRKAGVPFIMGPLNGGLPWPAGFDSDRRKEREWLSYVRGLYRFLPNRMATLRAASVIIAGSRHTASEIPAEFAAKVTYMPENGIDPTRFSQAASRPDGQVLRLCFIGRLVPYKGPDMALLAALPLLKSRRAHFDVIGSGPMEDQLRALVAAEKIGDAVTFHGWVPQDRLQEIATQSQIFVFPSVREFGGGAVLEAMALGLVPVVVGYGGPGELVSAGGGIAVPLASRGEIVAKVRDVLFELIDDESRISSISAAARTWVFGHMTWSAKASEMLTIYEAAISRLEA